MCNGTVDRTEKVGAIEAAGKSGCSGKYSRYKWNGSADERDRVLAMQLHVDEERYQGAWDATGIYVRAQRDNGDWETVDISSLTKKSLLVWLKSEGGDNRFAEDAVGIMLEHGVLH